MGRVLAVICVCVFGCLTVVAEAAMLNVRIENLQPGDGFFFTPVWIGVHDGSFDLFDVDGTASTQLEALAEGGDTQPVGEFFIATANAEGIMTTVLAPAGFEDLPVFDPGDDVSFDWDVGDPTINRFLNYASMIIPSNDAFFGNDVTVELFDEDGTFVGPATIEVRGINLYDARTELNDGMGAPFSSIFGFSTDEAGNIGILPGLNNFYNTETSAGTTIGSGVEVNELVARLHISAVPEPASNLALLGVGVIWWHRRRA